MKFFTEDAKEYFLYGGVTLTGIGAAVLVYSYYNSQPLKNDNILELRNEIGELRKEIQSLKASIPKTFNELQYSIDSIKEALKSRNFSSSRSNASFRTAWSEEEDDITRDFVTSLTESIPTDQSLPLDDSKQTDLNALFERVDELYDGSDEDKENAMRMLQDNEFENKDNWKFLWRLGRSHIGAYTINVMFEQKKTHAEAAMRYLESSLKFHEESADVHKWYAIGLGAMTDFISTKEKIENGYKLKEHVEKALHYAPNDPILFFMLGRWCWGVYMLTWIERKIASTLFATPPTATIDDALKNFMKAEEVNPGFYKSNQLFIGKCYYEQSQYSEAKKWFESAKAIEIVTSDDKTSHDEVLQFLVKY